MQIKRTIKGHEFAVQFRAVERAETLGHAEPAYSAHVTIYRDGRDIGSGRWDARGFLVAQRVLADEHDSDAVLHVLAVAIRGHLAATYARAGERVRREPDYVEMPAADTSHPVQRLIAARMADPLRAGPIVSVGMADDAATSMQRVTFAPGLRGGGLRCMAVYARGFGEGGVPPWGAAWRALADALDAAAERAEAGNAPEAP